MIEITERELLQQESVNNTIWQNLIDDYQGEHSGNRQECEMVMEMLKALRVDFACCLFAAAAAKLQTDIGHQTGKAYTRDDF